jgi:predicted cation transporter
MAGVVVVPEEPILGVTLGLTVILLLVLILPFKVKKVEENLEPFFFVMGLAAVALNYYYGIIPGTEELVSLFQLAFKTPLAIVNVGGVPIGIVQAVIFFGLMFYYFHRQIYAVIGRLINLLGLPVFAFAIAFTLGLISSVISVIVSAVILAEIVAALKISKRDKVRFTVFAAFALGLGAALTPIGEPLSTIAVSKLNAPFDYLLRLLGPYVIPGVALSALAAAWALRGYWRKPVEVHLTYEETLRGVLERGFRVFLFVAALELLGVSFEPMVKWYFSKLPSWALYWINTVSAVLDNATLTAAEISPYLTEEQIRSALMSLLISGGMLIPGNIPNIVAAGRLKITSREWAEVGVPFGIAMLILFFIIIEVVGIHVTLY